MDTIAKMKDIDHRYRLASGLVNRKFYSIFYSRIDPAEVLVLGINPGGDPNIWSEDELASKSFYENWEHEYVDCSYAIQQPMLPFLMTAFDVDRTGVRRIPKANLAFRRSNGVDAIKASHGMSMRDAQREALPFVEEILSYVQPRIIVLEGITLLEDFSLLYCQRPAIEELCEPIRAKHRGRPVRILCGQSLRVRRLGRVVPVIALGHPSHFGAKPEFRTVTKRVSELVRRIRASNSHDTC